MTEEATDSTKPGLLYFYFIGPTAVLKPAQDFIFNWKKNWKCFEKRIKQQTFKKPIKIGHRDHANYQQIIQSKRSVNSTLNLVPFDAYEFVH